ncbi:hypothetical protein CQJ94_08585 [Glycomyces fuscus]|nr:hypothetical protein CQJ94_08585 [Glycomyces fuscus]
MVYLLTCANAAEGECGAVLGTDRSAVTVRCRPERRSFSRGMSVLAAFLVRRSITVVRRSRGQRGATPVPLTATATSACFAPTCSG